ncbi:putative XRCC4-like factor-domain-containing protein [Seiridium unicorne]|uniref:Non-homologous end-joining factor 1 n=1 Tax=Seiridium unicorne TaxID=138068 RepID=A0ABR2V2U0_9PEZI
MGSISWKPLPGFEDLPALFVHPVFSSQSYRLHVTDLANVWVEELDRKSIGRRSLNEDTSIDPTEGPDKMILLLAKIQAAFESSSPDHDQTSISIAAPFEGGDGTFALTVICHLPDGLKPLKWTFHLTQCPTASIASELVVPLIQAQHSRVREVQQLIATLKEKDQVIDRLLDKIESAGVGLENVFNTLSGKRKPSREVANEKVNGLAPFKEADWRSKHLPAADMQDGIAQDVTSLIEDIVSEPIHHDAMRISIPENLNEWWTRLGSEPITGAPREQRKKNTKLSQDTQVHTQSKSRPPADDDDDFQIQTTPPSLASARKRRTEVDLDATTDDEAEAIPDSHPAPSRPAKPRLGTIGKGKSAKPPPESHSPRNVPAADDDTASESDDEPAKPPPHHNKASHLDMVGKTPARATSHATHVNCDPKVLKDDDKTESESEDDEPSKDRSPSSSHEGQVPKRRLGTIGQIGGEARQTSAEPGGGSKSPDAQPAIPTRRKIGAIGRRMIGDQRQENGIASQSIEEAETDEQRAERKRLELARELERKANAKPVKKKRKF